jgi:hypothetical protein
MKKIIPLCIASLFLCSCSTLYYGYLPGTEYKLLKPVTTIDLKGRAFNIEFKDSRGNTDHISCSDYTLDRETELEGNFGMEFLRQEVTTMIEASNGKVDPSAPDKVVVDLNGLSFKLIGAFYIVAHGFVEFRATSPYLNKTYCSDMTDHDKDAPLAWYSFVTRKTATRLMVSGSMRRAVESFVKDLSELPTKQP